ncbi:MAG: carboxypeptidase-like regulatory domain-containing protein [Gemmatimonadota bacterium]
MTHVSTSRAVLLLGLLLAAACRALPAQAVRGTLVEEGSDRPVPGTLVVLLDAAGNQVGGALSGADGAFLVRAPAAGRFQLRAERIGVRGAASRGVELAAGQTLDVRLAAPAAAAFALEGLVVRRERKRCRALPQAGEQAAAVWDEVRKALGVAAWTERQRSFSFRLAQHERELDPASLAVRREAGRQLTGTAANPYRTLPPDELAEQGYVQSRGDTSLYFAPDAAVLLSDAFLDAHCFRVEPGGRQQPGLVGLAFEPARAAAGKGILGVLWVDRESAELRHLDFAYPAPELDGPTEHLGGRVEFERLPGGAWVVRRWRIRMPRVAQRVMRLGGASLARGTVQAIREEGGEILEIRTAAGQLVRAAGRARLVGVVRDSAGAGPLPGVAVRLAGTPYAAQTGVDGRFRMGDLPEGRYRVEVDHPRLDSLGIPAPAREVELRRDGEARVELAAPSTHEIVALLCPGGLAPRQGVLLGTVAGGAAGVEGSAVTVDWSRWDVVNEQFHAGSGAGGGPPVVVSREGKQATAGLDERGRFRVCGVPADVPLGVHVESAGVRGRPDTVRVAAGEVRRLHLRTPVRAAGASAAEPVALEGVTVVAARRERALETAGFYDRRRMASGAFFTGRELEGKDLAAVIRSAGMQVRLVKRGFVAFAPRALGSDQPCQLPVFVDGRPVSQEETAGLLDAPLAAVEVYRDHTELPPRFRTPGSACGAVVAWTAPGR